MKSKRSIQRSRVRTKVRSKIAGNSERPRLSVFRSNKQIYAQIIDDVSGNTLTSASSIDKEIASKNVNKVERAKLVGQLLAEKAKAAEVETVVFDRGGYIFHGRVKALADGAREGGLKF